MATITRLPSGKYRAQVRLKGISKGRTFPRKHDAQHWATDIERAIGGGGDTIQAPSDMTLAMVIAAYLDQVPVGKTARYNLEKMSRTIGTTSIRNLNAVTIQSFVDRRLAEKITGATLSRDLSALSSVLKWARHIRKIDIDTSLAKEARASLSAERIDTRSKERDRLPTPAEMARLLDYFDTGTHTMPMGQIVRFAAASAMRQAEICRITIEDVNWNEKSVMIRQRKDPKRKERNDQSVPLVGTSYDIARLQAVGRTEGRLFPCRAESVSHAFRRACVACGIKDLRFHDLRHLAITELFRLGLPIELVAIVSGHQDWKQLRRYTQLDAGDVHARLDALTKTV